MNAFFSHNNISYNNIKTFGVIFIISFVLLFFLSPDSYTHDLFYRYDSACFFTCGKAWMNGLVPYVDFSDSKGPVLWLIYGLGYLIDNNSYIGVFWISCLFYTITFWYCYKIILLFISNKKLALLGDVCMAFPFFITWFHYEIRAEDFCLPFIAIQIYYLCYVLLKKDIHTRKIKNISFILGICIACCLLIKWSIAIMSIIFILSLIINKKINIITIIYYILGIISICIPFIFYFIVKENLIAFIHEYFLATYDTVKSPVGDMLQYYFTIEWKSVFTTRIFVFFIYLVGSAIIGIYYKCLKIFPFICNLWFFSICLRNGTVHQYYLTISSIFAIFTIIIILRVFKDVHLSSILTAFIILIIVSINIIGNIPSHKNLFYIKEHRNSYYKLVTIMSTIKSPKILFQRLDNGIGTPINALPACKYWIKQNGATNDMIKERRRAIELKKPDFIIVSNPNDSIFMKIINTANYICYGKTIGGTPDESTYVYGKPGITYSNINLYINNKDILFKRDIINHIK